MSSTLCFELPVPNGSALSSAWGKELSVSSATCLTPQRVAADDGPFTGTFLEEGTGLWDLDLPQEKSAGTARNPNAMYSLADDYLIHSTVAKAKNKLSAKKLVAQKLGRSYSGILNRYHILKSLTPEERGAIADLYLQKEATADSVFLYIKRVPSGQGRKNAWQLTHLIENGAQRPVLAERKCISTFSSSLNEGTQPSPDLTEPSLASRPKTAEAPPAKKKIRGPYVTQHKRLLEQVRGQGSQKLSQFLAHLLQDGFQSGLFKSEDLCENVFVKHRHAPRLIEMVIERGTSRSDPSL